MAMDWPCLSAHSSDRGIQIPQSRNFWGVFVATLLSFIASVCIEKWLEEKSNLKADEEENFEKRRAISLLIREIAKQKNLNQISSYFGTVLSASETDLMARSTDGFYLRFQTASKTAL